MAREPTASIECRREQLELERRKIPDVINQLHRNVADQKGRVEYAERYLEKREHTYQTMLSLIGGLHTQELKEKMECARRWLGYVVRDLRYVELELRTHEELNKQIDLKLAELDRTQEEIWRSIVLWDAAQEGNVAAIEAALASRVDININHFANYSPLGIAIKNQHLDAVYYLLTMKINPNICPNGRTHPLKLAWDSGQYDLASRLVNVKSTIDYHTNRQVNQELRVAIASNDIDFVRQLLRIGAGIGYHTVSGELPIHSAVRHCHLNIVEQLIECKADVNSTSRSHQLPLTVAVRTGCTNVVVTLLEAKADINMYSRGRVTALSTAITNSYKTMCVLLDAKADLHQLAENNMTPLGIAAENGRLNAVRTLLYAKANVNNSGSNANVRPLDIVPEGPYAEKIRRLLTNE